MARKRKFYSAAGPGEKRSQTEAIEIDRLEQLLQSAPTASLPAASRAKPHTNVTDATKFDELPLSQYTKDGLQQSGFTHLTAIQKAAVPHALHGKDILGAAKTGSGKTLAFLIPASRIIATLSLPRCISACMTHLSQLPLLLHLHVSSTEVQTEQPYHVHAA